MVSGGFFFSFPYLFIFFLEGGLIYQRATRPALEPQMTWVERSYAHRNERLSLFRKRNNNNTNNNENPTPYTCYDLEMLSFTSMVSNEWRFTLADFSDNVRTEIKYRIGRTKTADV